MTKNNLLKICLLLCFALSGVLKAQNQNMTATVLIQPCNNNGKIGVTTTGLTPPISYTYTNWSAQMTIVHSNMTLTTDDLTGIPAFQSQWGSANFWSISASDGSNNTAFASVNLQLPFTDSIKVNVGNCPAPSTLQAIGFAGGTAPYSCMWTNLTNSVVYSTNPATVTNGNYRLVVTDAAGCMVSTATGSGNINVQSIANFSVNISGTSANCTNGTATVNVSNNTNSPFTYQWNTNATSQSINGLSLGSYNCVVTDALGCQSTGYYYCQQAVTINFNATVGNATCLQNNGTITSFVNGGTAPYLFNWSNFATTQNLTGLPAGSYNVQVTDAVGCKAYGYVTVNASTPINVTYQVAASSCTASTGGATLVPTGGQAPYTYLWYVTPSGNSSSVNSRPAGNYSFKITDANGCIRTGAVVIPQQSSINANISANAVICPATTGTVGVFVTGSNAPFTYQWNNNSTATSVNNVPLGPYTCTITDAVGCKVVKSASLYQTSLINIGANAVPVNCQYASNGVITAVATGGQAPYTYLWSNNQTGSNINGLAMGYYHVTVTDANGCVAGKNVYVGNSGTSNTCYCTITGTVYTDNNNNCIRNLGENGVQNIAIHCSGIGYAYTNANGVYQFQVPSGTYVISEVVQQIYPLSACQSNNQTVTVVAGANCQSIVNFANNVVPVSDLKIFTSNLNMPVPGNPYFQRVIVQNDGTMTEGSIKLSYKHDGQLNYGTCAPWALTQPNSTSYPTWFRINSGFTSLGPGLYSQANINYMVPTNIPVNTQLVFEDSVAKNAPIATQWLTDNSPWNNVETHNAYVVSSYDPNFKEVSPAGTGPQGIISTADTILNYVVHFQNTGNYFAQNIVVIDSLDANIRISSMKPGYSDHHYVATMDENGVAKFTFSGINLPWKSAYGDATSSGMFSFSVRLKKGLPIGTQIRNKAAIYFDYNDPIITNQTLNTIGTVKTIGLEQVSGAEKYFSAIFPNPATDRFTVRFVSEESNPGTLSVYDVSGREVINRNITVTEGNNDITESCTQLTNGIYIVNLHSGNITIEKKLVITK